MANQGKQDDQGQGNQGGNEGQGLGQRGSDLEKPTGTSGRQGSPGDQNKGEGNREIGRRKNADDDDSPLGTRTTNR